MSHTTTITLREELVKKVHELAPVLGDKEKLQAIQEERRVSDETIKALEEIGAFKLHTPKRYGGLETDFITMKEVVSAVGEYDGSTAWVVNLINICNWLVGLYPKEAQDDVFGANPNAKVSGVTSMNLVEAKKVPRGFKVTGKWYYNSGGWHSDWSTLAIPLTNEEGEVTGLGMALIPQSELTDQDTWYVAGMRGSGSICKLAEDVFVPEHRVLDMGKVIATGVPPTEFYSSEALYRSAAAPVLIHILVFPVLGVVRTALDFVVESAKKKPITGSIYKPGSTSAGLQIRLAKVKVMLAEAELLSQKTCEEIDQMAIDGVLPDFEQRAMYRAFSGKIADLLIEAMSMLLDAHGAASFAETNKLQKFWRDVNTGARHQLLISDLGYESYGKALFGMGMEESIVELI